MPTAPKEPEPSALILLTSGHVVVINKTFARIAWPAGEAIERCIILGADSRNPCFDVIGVVADARRFTVVPEEPTM